jgi:hypothetical protein
MVRFPLKVKIPLVREVEKIVRWQCRDHLIWQGMGVVTSWANIRAIKSILLLFESMSGLKLNFHRSQLVRVNVEDSWLDKASWI